MYPCSITQENCNAQSMIVGLGIGTLISQGECSPIEKHRHNVTRVVQHQIFPWGEKVLQGVLAMRQDRKQTSIL